MATKQYITRQRRFEARVAEPVTDRYGRVLCPRCSTVLLKEYWATSSEGSLIARGQALSCYRCGYTYEV